MSICSRLGAAAVAGSVLSMVVLAVTHAQQATPTPSPARRAGGAASSVRTAAPVPKPAAEGDGFKVEYREFAVGPGWAVTPEAQKLHAAEVEAANEAQAHVKALANASAQDRESLKTAIRDALARQFDAQQKRRSEEIASIEERLGKLKETLQKRGAAKEAIVGKRLDQLMGVKDELAWEETGAFPTTGAYPTTTRPGAMNPNLAPRYAPGVIPPVGTTYVPAQPSSPFQTIPPVPVPTGPTWPAPPSPAAVPATPALPVPPAPAAAPLVPSPNDHGDVQPSLEPPAAAPLGT